MAVKKEQTTSGLAGNRNTYHATISGKTHMKKWTGEIDALKTTDRSRHLNVILTVIMH